MEVSNKNLTFSGSVLCLRVEDEANQRVRIVNNTDTNIR